MFHDNSRNESTELSLESELGSAPVTTLRVVLDGIIRSEANPLGQRTVLPLLLGEGALRAEGLLRCLGWWSVIIFHSFVHVEGGGGGERRGGRAGMRESGQKWSAWDVEVGECIRRKLYF